MTIKRLDIPFSIDLLSRYETINETPLTTNNGHYIKEQREQLEREILTVVRGVSSAYLAESSDLLTNTFFSNQPAIPKFNETYCSNCGDEFGPGDSGFSHCDSHAGMRAKP